MITTASRWDAGYATVYNAQAPNKNLDVDLPNLTVAENRGQHMFIVGPNQGSAGCAACHVQPTYALIAMRAAMDSTPAKPCFQVASLKNDSRGPYMHDGRFTSMASRRSLHNGVLDGPALDPRLTGGVPQRLNLSAADKAAIVAFLGTLDDRRSSPRALRESVQAVSRART